MSNFTVAASASSPPGSAAITTASATTTTTTTVVSAAKNDSSPSGSSPDSLGDNSDRSGSNAAQSSSSDGNSPMRRLPAVLRAPPGSNALNSSSNTTCSASTPTTVVTTKSQALSEQSNQNSDPTTAGHGNRDLPGTSRRHIYPGQSLPSPYGGSAKSSVSIQPQFFSAESGRVTTVSSSYNHNRQSPVSPPSMADESWAQSASGSTVRGLKRHLPQSFDGSIYSGYGVRTPASGAGSSLSVRLPPPQSNTQNSGIQNVNSIPRRRPPSVNGAIVRSAPQSMYGTPPSENPMQYETSSEARHPRDSTRYETWTSKQLRKKCSHLKLRGLKNVKKHVMVEALYRYYRNQRLKEMAEAATANHNDSVVSPASQQRRTEARCSSNSGGNSTPGTRPDMQYRSRYDPGTPSQSQYSSRSHGFSNYGTQMLSPTSSGGESGGQLRSQSNHGNYYFDEVAKEEYKEVPVTSEDVIRLVDVVLSPEFVDRLAAELSRWQFWVDVREMYIALLNRQHPGSVASGGDAGPVGTGGSATNSRNFKWSSMQLWEIWKELTFAYTKTCFEFTAAGMKKRVDDREYINFCDGRPDVYYLHQRLHARPDLLHLIKSNEYIDEKCTSEASESIAHEQQQAQQQHQPGHRMNSASPLMLSHKRYTRPTPMPGTAQASAAYDSARAIAAFRNGATEVEGAAAPTRRNNGDNGSGQGSGDSRGHSPEENSTENSETTGEEGSSSNTANSNASNSSLNVSMRAALAEQKYFGLLLQNFEVIFESLHNKKVLLATLRKDSKAPDHLIADLHDDIHVLSALKKEFRNKLRHTMQ